MNILFIGDIVGKPGREAVARLLPKIKQQQRIDLVIANAENAAGGSGVTASVAEELFNLGCQILTSGDHIWRRPEVVNIIEHPYLLRPANYAPNTPGKGYCIYSLLEDNKSIKVAIINLQGRVFMQPIECPFRTVRDILSSIKNQTNIILVDMHAEATSEKIALGYFLEGTVTAVVGTHTHVQTADEKILPGGTAYITDIGMTGPHDSVIGRKKEKVIERFISGMPTRFELATEDVRLEGVIIEVNIDTGKAVSIKRIQEKTQD